MSEYDSTSTQNYYASVAMGAPLTIFTGTQVVRGMITRLVNGKANYGKDREEKNNRRAARLLRFPASTALLTASADEKRGMIEKGRGARTLLFRCKEFMVSRMPTTG